MRQTYPAGVDPQRFDPSAFLPTALAQARTKLPDAELGMLAFRGVGADGRLDLTLDAAGTGYMFRSPSAGAAKPPTVKRVCMVNISLHPAGYDVIAAPSDGCLPTSLRPPRCTLAEVWRRAKEQGADATLAASITLMPQPPGAKVQQWLFDTGAHSLMIFDDCGLASPTDNPADPKPSLPGMVLLPFPADAAYDLRESGRFSVPLPKPAPELDASAYVATATKLAHLLEPDAVLERIELRPVDAKGHLAIRTWKLDDRPGYAYWFSSAARASAKPGPDDVYLCEVVVEIDTYRGDKAYVKRVGDKTCPTQTPKPPRCTVADIWARGLANGAPATAEASITYHESGVWWFDDVKNYGAWNRMTFADDCR